MKVTDKRAAAVRFIKQRLMYVNDSITVHVREMKVLQASAIGTPYRDQCIASRKATIKHFNKERRELIAALKWVRTAENNHADTSIKFDKIDIDPFQMQRLFGGSIENGKWQAPQSSPQEKLFAGRDENGTIRAYKEHEQLPAGVTLMGQIIRGTMMPEVPIVKINAPTFGVQKIDLPPPELPRLNEIIEHRLDEMADTHYDPRTIILKTGIPPLDPAAPKPKLHPFMWRFLLFKYMSDEHGITLLDSEMDEIINIVRKMDSKND